VLFPPCPKYNDALVPLAAEKGIKWHKQQNLESIDGENRTAVMKDLVSGEFSTVPFDMLHVVPPQSAPKFVRESPLAAANGYLDVNLNTLQHNKFPNVWGLGDICNLPTSKTAAAVFSQAPVLVDQISNAIENKTSNAKYDGYSACPVFVGDGKLMLIEFKYGQVPDETFSPNQTKPNRFNYYLKKYFFAYAYFNWMPKGNYFGRNFFQPKF